MEKTQINPIEDQRKQALEHYEEVARIGHHWSSFVRNAILAYNPSPVSLDTHTAEDILYKHLIYGRDTYLGAQNENILKAMTEYASLRENKAIQEAIQILSDSETKLIALRELERLKKPSL